MTRREFLKNTAAFVFLCGMGFGTKSVVSGIMSVNAEDSIGPLLSEDLLCIPTLNGGKAFADGELVFEVNSIGYRLLKYADGKHTLDSIVNEINRPEITENIVDFYIALGKSGYLQNRIEVCKFSNEI